jgi:hypothetical protein
LYADDDSINSDALWILANISLKAEDDILMAIASGDTLPKVIRSIDVDNRGVLFVPALKAMSSLTALNDQYVLDKILYEGLLKKLYDFLCYREKLSLC